MCPSHRWIIILLLKVTLVILQVLFLSITFKQVKLALMY